MHQVGYWLRLNFSYFYVRGLSQSVYANNRLGLQNYAVTICYYIFPFSYSQISLPFDGAQSEMLVRADTYTINKYFALHVFRQRVDDVM